MNRQIKSLLAIFSIFFIVLSSYIAKEVIFPMGPIVKWVSADAGTCNDADQGSISGSGTFVSHTAPSGKVVLGVCIKAGTTHSQSLTTNGTYGSPFVSGCYTVSGLGTQTVSITKNFSSSSCKDISHIDVYYGNGASPSPSNSPSVSPSPSASPSSKPSSSPSTSPSPKASPSVSPEPSESPSSEPSSSPSTEPSGSPQSEVSPSPSPSASPSTEASSTPSPSQTPGNSNDSGVGGGEITDPGQVLGLSTTSGEYELNSAIVFALGIISSSVGLFISKKKNL